jgi:O-antigen ligase
MSGVLTQRLRGLLAESGLRPGDGAPWLLAAMMLLVPAVGVPHEYLLQDTLKSMMVAFLTLGAAWLLLWQLRTVTEPVRWHGLLWLPVLLMLYALGSMAWSHAYLAGVEAVRWFVFAVLLWVGLNVLTLERLPMLATGIHWGAVLASVWVGLQYWADVRLFPQAAVPASTFVNRNFFAEFVVSTVPFSVLLLAQARGTGQILLRAFTTAFNVLAILMTGTRSALFALLLLTLVLPVILWLYRSRFELARWSQLQRWMVALVMLGTVLGLGSIETRNPTLLAERQGAAGLAHSLARLRSLGVADQYVDGSPGVRLQMWRATGRLMLDHPLAGVGAGAWEVAIPPYQAAATQLETDYYAHNEIIQLLAEYGLVGWLVLLALLAYLLRAAWVTWRLGRVDPEGQEAPWRAMTLAGLLAFLVVSNAGFPWRLAATGALFALCLAILAASDLRLRPTDRTVSLRPSWRPWAAYGALACTAFSMGLTVWISLQAAAAESRLIGALKIAAGINMSGDPLHPHHDARKAELLRLVREGIAINPHYRKITPIVADQLVRWGDWRNALWIWESVVASRPNVVALLANTARAHIQLGELPQAQVYFERARAIQPEAPVVHTLEIALLMHRGELAQAAQLSRTYLQRPQIDQDLTLTAYLLGLRTQDWELAIQALTQRRLRWPQLAVDSWYKLGQLYARPELRDAVHAQQAFQAALDAAPATFRDKVREVIPQPYRSALRPPAP